MGRLFDANGNRMSPTHTNKRGVRYLYYLSTAPKETAAGAGNSERPKSAPHRIPASKIEAAALRAASEFEAKSVGKDHEGLATQTPMTQALEVPLTNPNDTCSDFQQLASVNRVDVTAEGAVFTMESKEHGRRQTSTVEIPIDWHQPVRRDIRSPDRSRQQTRSEKLAARKQRANEKLVRAIAIAHRRYRLISSGDVQTIRELASRENCSVRAIRLGLNLAWLAPDIVQAAIDGKLDASISATELARNLPADWTAQRRLVGLQT